MPAQRRQNRNALAEYVLNFQPAVVRDSTLFSTETADSQLVWMSHGDEAVKLPEGFSVVARSEQVSRPALLNPLLLNTLLLPSASLQRACKLPVGSSEVAAVTGMLAQLRLAVFPGGSC